MKRASLSGVRITQGPADWQMLQRRLDGSADIVLAGTWLDQRDRMGRVEIRIVDEATRVPAATHLDWHDADTSPDRTWRHLLRDVPAGGPYRLETRLRLDGDPWRLAGDNIHHLGIGDIWLVAGDDNAVGFGQGTADDGPEYGVHAFGKNESWSLATHPLHDMTGIRNSRHFSSGAAGHSPWLAFGRVLRRALGIPVGLVPAAVEGLPIAAWHNPGKPTPAFDNLLALLSAASSMRDYANFSLLDGGPCFLQRPEGQPGTAAGMVWFHGNADTRKEGSAKHYKEHLAGFVTRLRNALSSPGLPVIIPQLNRVVGLADSGESRNWGKVREAQRAAAHDVAMTAAVPTLDAGLSNGIHNSARGNVVIGERAARAALGLVYGKPGPWKAPDFAAAGFVNGERNRLELEFANVSGELSPITAEIASLTAADENGGAAIRKVELVRPNRLIVTLIRDLGETPTISFCAGHNPPPALVDDSGTPPLAFADIGINEE